ncbi:hypothetical protein BDQ17DRAFT_1369100 [Cyathus striatus]|nr:hypothetical protein BDQ17DRAFT_1369100 [Cyathus striatus]
MHGLSSCITSMFPPLRLNGFVSALGRLVVLCGIHGSSGQLLVQFLILEETYTNLISHHHKNPLPLAGHSFTLTSFNMARHFRTFLAIYQHLVGRFSRVLFNIEAEASPGFTLLLKSA